MRLDTGTGKAGDTTMTSAKKTRVLHGEDNALMAFGVRTVLEASGRFEVVAHATSGSAVLVLVEREQPDVVLLDLGLPGLDELTCISRIRNQHPAVPVIVLSGRDGEDDVRRSLAAGAQAYISKSIATTELADALSHILENGSVVAVGIPAPDPSWSVDGLTAREQMILEAVARGLTNAEIGKELSVSLHTVKFHLANIYRKLVVTNRTEAAWRAPGFGGDRSTRF